MVRIERDVWIDESRKRVFEYMAVPENHREVMPSLHDVRDVEELPNGGTKGEVTFKMLGISNDIVFEDVTFDPPSRRVYEMSGDVEGEVRYRFEEEDGGTRFTYELDSSLPSRVLNRVLEPVARRYNEREIEATLENLKALLEMEAEAEQAA
ncbi:SRPBCC family protein [Natronorarus salvus]|uniref:SRPBCC family protein n=1 Tax=Natronorarus salvus TaxID=3117733 RepID=UPI002F267415